MQAKKEKYNNLNLDVGPRQRQVPKGDNFERLICPDCGFVQYDNPLVIVGAVVTYGDKYLLCRRAIEPCKGLWTIPAGYMELNETPLAGAAREVWEEACAKIDIDALLAIYTVERISQVQMIYRAELRMEDFAAGEESLEVGLFDFEDIPWADIAFPTVHWALHHHQESQGQSIFSPFGNPDKDITTK